MGGMKELADGAGERQMVVLKNRTTKLDRDH